MKGKLPRRGRGRRPGLTPAVMASLCAVAALMQLGVADASDTGKSSAEAKSSQELAPAGEDVLLFPSHPGLIIVPVAVSDYQVLRVQTDRVRKKPDGETEQVYELQHPRPGAVFVEFVLQVSNDAEPWMVRPLEVRLKDPESTDRPVVPLRDLATESGRIAFHTEEVRIDFKDILHLRFEPDQEGLLDLTLWIGELNLGSVAELRSLARPVLVETEAGTIEHRD